MVSVSLPLPRCPSSLDYCSCPSVLVYASSSLSRFPLSSTHHPVSLMTRFDDTIGRHKSMTWCNDMIWCAIFTILLDSMTWFDGKIYDIEKNLPSGFYRLQLLHKEKLYHHHPYHILRTTRTPLWCRDTDNEKDAKPLGGWYWYCSIGLVRPIQIIPRARIPDTRVILFFGFTEVRDNPFLKKPYTVEPCSNGFQGTNVSFSFIGGCLLLPTKESWCASLHIWKRLWSFVRPYIGSLVHW